MSTRGEVLVAIINNRHDLASACERRWYRIPVGSARKWVKERWPPAWLADLHRVLPVKYAADVVRGTLTEGVVDGLGLPCMVLGAWCRLGIGATYAVVTRKRYQASIVLRELRCTNWSSDQ
jgi:hypothetical protein